MLSSRYRPSWSTVRRCVPHGAALRLRKDAGGSAAVIARRSGGLTSFNVKVKAWWRWRAVCLGLLPQSQLTDPISPREAPPETGRASRQREV
jgi:hypothetical protein